MKLKRMLTMCVMLMVILFTMSGCMGLHYTVEITEDGGTLTQAIIAEETATQTEEVEIYEVNGSRYARAQLHADSFDSHDALAKRLNGLTMQEICAWMNTSDEGMNKDSMALYASMMSGEMEPLHFLRDVRIETDKFSGEVTISGYIIYYQDSDEGFPVVLDLKFPGEILEHTVGKKLDGNTLQIVLNDYWTQGTDTAFTVRAKLPGANGWIFAVLAALVGAAMLCFVIRHKRRGQKNQETSEETAGEESVHAAEEDGSEEPAEQTPGEEPEQSVQSE